MSKHKISIIFLSIINVISICAGVVTQLKMITGADVTSVIPISASLTVNQVLMVNFVAATFIMMLISVITMYLACDVNYTLSDIFSNCAFIFLIIPIAIACAAVYNAIKAPIMIDKISIIAGAAVYVLFSAVNTSCVLTVKEDSEL